MIKIPYLFVKYILRNPYIGTLQNANKSKILLKYFRFVSIECIE